MTFPLLAALWNFVTEPTLGIPVLLSAWVFAAWLLWSASTVERRPPLLRRSWFPPSADLASYVHFALADQSYSRIVSAVRLRLDDAVRGRFGRGLAGLPLTPWGAQWRGIPYAADLRRAGRALHDAEAGAVAREGRFFIRWRFWRTAGQDYNDFLGRVADAIAEATDWIRRLESSA